MQSEQMFERNSPATTVHTVDGRPCDGVRKAHWTAKSSFTFNWPPPGLFGAEQPITIQQDIIELPLTKQLAAYVPALDPGCRTKPQRHMKLSKPRRITASEVCECLQMWGIQPPAVLQDPCNADKQVIYVPHQPQQRDGQDSDTDQHEAAHKQHALASRDPCSSILDQAYKAAVQAARTAARVQAMADIVAADESYSAADKEEAQQLANLACAAARQAARGATSIVKACHKPTNCGVDVCSVEAPTDSHAAAVAAYRKEAMNILQEAAAASGQQPQHHYTPVQPRVGKREACEQALEKHQQGSCLPAALQRKYKVEEVMVALEWALVQEQYSQPVGLSGLVSLLQTKQQLGISRWRLFTTAVTKLPLLWASKDSSSDEAAELLEQLKKDAKDDQPLARVSSSLEQQLRQKDKVREGRQLLVECKVWHAMAAPSEQYLQLMRMARLWPPRLRQLGREAANVYNKPQKDKKAEEEHQQQLLQQQAADLAAAAAARSALVALADAAVRPASPGDSETTGNSSSRASTPDGDNSALFERSLSPDSMTQSGASGFTDVSLLTSSCSSCNHSCTSKATNKSASQSSVVGSAMAAVGRLVVDAAALRGSKAASPGGSSATASPSVAAPAADSAAASSSNSFTARLPSPRAASRLGLASRTASASALAAQEEHATAAAALLLHQQQQVAAGGLFKRLQHAMSRRNSACSKDGGTASGSGNDSAVSSTGPSSIQPFVVELDPVGRLRSGSLLLHNAQRRSAAGREAMMRGAEPARSFSNPQHLAAAMQRCTSLDPACLTGLESPAAAAASAATQHQNGSHVSSNGQTSSAGIAAPGTTSPHLAGRSGTIRAAASATALAAALDATPSRPAVEEPAAEETQDFEAMWQNVAAHLGLDPQLSLAHEQQLAELTGEAHRAARRKKGPARYA